MGAMCEVFIVTSELVNGVEVLEVGILVEATELELVLGMGVGKFWLGLVVIADVVTPVEAAELELVLGMGVVKF